MSPDLVQPAMNLGVAGFAILVMWWMYKDSGRRLDNKDEGMRALEREVRNSIMGQLGKNTNAFERVLDLLNKK